MKRIKIILSVWGLSVFFLAASANAQNVKDLKNATPEKRAAFQTDMMKSKLQLDAGQLTKVSAINLKYAQKFEPILKGDGSRFARFRQAMSLQNTKDDELKAVFTAAQYNRYKDFENDLKNKMMEKAKEKG